MKPRRIVGDEDSTGHYPSNNNNHRTHLGNSDDMSRADGDAVFELAACQRRRKAEAHGNNNFNNSSNENRANSKKKMEREQ